MGAEDRISELGLVLPDPPSPRANYVSAVRSGSLLFVSGHGPYRPDGSMTTGKVGGDLSLEEGRDAARLVGLNLLATLRRELDSLDRVTRVVKVLGMVNCAPGFVDSPAVINGCSDLLVEVFGAAIGSHARSAVGVFELPFNIAVEVEMICEVDENPT
ncbi:MAG: RidA family protein [Acidimicrobiales bacterium]|jgi:enamine deaminase RidA (YjgF/YER057c/UK114 family)